LYFHRNFLKTERCRIKLNQFNILKENRMRIRFLFTAILFSLLASCSAENNSSGASSGQGKSPSASEEEKALVDNEDLTAGLKGVDADNKRSPVSLSVK